MNDIVPLTCSCGFRLGVSIARPGTPPTYSIHTRLWSGQWVTVYSCPKCRRPPDQERLGRWYRASQPDTAGGLLPF